VCVPVRSLGPGPFFFFVARFFSVRLLPASFSSFLQVRAAVPVLWCGLVSQRLLPRVLFPSGVLLCNLFRESVVVFGLASLCPALVFWLSEHVWVVSFGNTYPVRSFHSAGRV